MDSPRCGTQHLLLALSRQPGPVADWLLIHASLGQLQEDPPEPAPPVTSLWPPRLGWAFQVILYLLVSLVSGPVFSLLALMLVPNLVLSLTQVGAYPVEPEKCPRCARPQELKAMFDHKTGLCRPCGRHQERLPGYRYLAVLGILGVASAISYSLDVPLGLWLANLGLLLLMQIAATLVHELGHALAGLLVGRRLLSFHLGRGGLHAHTRLSRLWLYFHLPALGGLTLAVRSQGQSRWTSLFFILGGPAANLLVVALLAPQILARPEWNPTFVWAQSIDPTYTFFLVNLMMVINNLYPAYVTLDGGKVMGTDGRQALDLLKAPKHHSAQVLQAVLLAQAQMFRHFGNTRAEYEVLQEAGRFVPLERALRMHQVMLLLKLRKISEAEALFEEIGELEGDVLPEHQCMQDNYRAWLDLHLGNMHSADHLSERSLLLFACAANKDTRGHVLLELDRLDEAEPLLWEAARQTYHAHSAATSLQALARLQQKRGSSDEASRLQRLAQEIDPTVPAWLV